MSLTLDSYRLLGRSGLRVSPPALGAATFGTEWGRGAEQDEARKPFDLYVGRGGSFIDTASTYTDGSSERLLGEFTASQLARLDEASTIDLGFPHTMLARDMIRALTQGDMKVETRR